MLEIKNVGFEVEQKSILKQINFRVADSEQVTIRGASGSGKSTLLKLIAKLISPTSGKILFDGEDIQNLETPVYRKQVSYCFQQPVLFGETVRDNFEFAFDIRGEALSEARVAETLERIKLTPAYLDQKIQDLSGGEKQRIALARNTLFLPKVLLLDEVTTGLDTDTKKDILTWLTDLNTNEKVTLIMVSHEEDVIKQAHRLIEIKNGEAIIHE